MALTTGLRLGPYEIVSPLGAGGMGEVYKARDTRLDRIVAIKVLPETFAADSEFRERFDREARTISQLDHPNICVLYDVGEQDGMSYLVMQYLEGETLEMRLKKGALPLDQALQYAIQIADGLDKAHRAGIVHRDLKPGNVMLTKAGAKLLDFGLAKAISGVDATAALSTLPTTPPNLTAQGTILGTFQYMAPEQLEGREADARTDIFALGAVVYEMLTGTKAFQGNNQAGLIGAILKDTPPSILNLQPVATPALDHVVHMCLAKDPEDRWQSARDVTLNLREPTIKSGNNLLTTASGPRWREWAAWGLAAVLALVLVSASFFRRSSFEPSRNPEVVRATIDAPPGTNFVLYGGSAGSVEVAPDGTQVVFSAGSAESTKLWLRALDTPEAKPLPGTEGGSFPFWSPNARFVAFSAGGRLMKIDVTRGTRNSVCEISSNTRSGSWNRNNDIIFSLNADSRLYRVSAEGGTAIPITTVDRAHHDVAHEFPQFLPDGRHYLFLLKSMDLARQGIYVGSLDSTDIKFVVNSRWRASYVAGHLLYLANNSSALLAQAFNLERFELTGTPLRLVDQIGVSGPGLAESGAPFSVSDAGPLAYHASLVSQSQMTWLNRSGESLGTLGPTGYFANPIMSPDGTQVAVDRWDPQRAESRIWLFDTSRGTGVPLKTGPGTDVAPAWSSDGSRIAFLGAFDATVALYQQRVKDGVTEILTQLDVPAFPTAWAPDGTLIATQLGNELDIQSFVVQKKTSIPVAAGPATEAQGTLSPDGKWLAYFSSDSGTDEVYVQPLGTPGKRVVVSTGSGSMPQWSADGREIYFIDSSNRSLSVASVFAGHDDRIMVGPPKRLFSLRQRSWAGRSFSLPYPRSYAMAPHSQRLLELIAIEDGLSHPMTLVLNWQAALGARERR